ncbi:hypothetical protein [Pseudonocardia cypriaca]|uniref:hypothetical protein n=1 Tax=Pseudonocardia cypriaca TaxID=882449 RepID=UPI00114FB996|nr:hypothetical protein [Pseudonocardia cypriaca]
MDDTIVSAAEAIFQHLQSGALSGVEQLAQDATQAGSTGSLALARSIFSRLLHWRSEHDLPDDRNTTPEIAEDLASMAADDSDAAREIDRLATSTTISAKAQRDVMINSNRIDNSDITHANFGFQIRNER